MKKKVLFLCTGNSCRSHMAEAIVNASMGEMWEAVSAGTVPVGYVHPLAIKVLKEVGVDHEGESKLVDVFRDMTFDLVVTVCDSEAEECPVWLEEGVRVHHSFPDPAKAAGSEEEVLDVFRQVRDDITRVIPGILKQF